MSDRHSELDLSQVKGILPVACGGTGSATSEGALANLGGGGGGGGADMFSTTDYNFMFRLVKDMGQSVLNNGGAVSDSVSGLSINSNNSANGNAYFGLNLIGVSGVGKGYTNVKVRCVLAFNGRTTNGESFYYPISNNTNPALAAHYAGIRVEGSSVYAVSKTPATSEEKTDITSVFGPLGYAKVIDVMTTATDVKYYIDGTLVATHTTSIPNESSLALVCGFRADNEGDTSWQTITASNLIVNKQL